MSVHNALCISMLFKHMFVLKILKLKQKYGGCSIMFIVPQHSAKTLCPILCMDEQLNSILLNVIHTGLQLNIDLMVEPFCLGNGWRRVRKLEPIYKTWSLCNADFTKLGKVYGSDKISYETVCQRCSKFRSTCDCNRQGKGQGNN